MHFLKGLFREIKGGAEMEADFGAEMKAYLAAIGAEIKAYFGAELEAYFKDTKMPDICRKTGDLNGAK